MKQYSRTSSAQVNSRPILCRAQSNMPTLPTITNIKILAAGQPTETAEARPGDDRKIQLTERRKSKQTTSNFGIDNEQPINLFSRRVDTRH